MKRIDPLDLEYIAIELEDIDSNDRKMMLLSYCRSRIDLIDYYLLLIEKGGEKYIIPNTQDELLRMKKYANDLYNRILNKKIEKVEYKLNIMYPEGFEG